jgi:hypothetical protein
VQSPEDGEAQDLALAAAARGWTIEEAAADRLAADVVGRIAAQAAVERPDIFVGSVLSQEPGGTPSLFIKGPADEFVLSLVAKAEIDVKIVDNQPFAFEELEKRKLEVHRALEAQGFKYISTGFNVTGAGQITAGVTRQSGLPEDAVHILSEVPQSLRADVALTVNAAVIVADEHAYGGMQLRDDGANECTSGWSVFAQSLGITGVTGAGHCDGINQIVEPGVAVWPLTFRGQHRGEWGDVEWYTSTHIEPAQFYADANSIRYVAALEPRAGISQGETVCLYGRASNSRNCTSRFKTYLRLAPTTVCSTTALS